ncbi:MAG: HDOD domain-containing protein [Pirellulaceae bacterium]
MRRILFVDDEPRILDGLSRMLRGVRHEWEMEFADGGRAALKCCAATPFDMVVSDARMPGMDGTELLANVMQSYPDTVRVILSGQCSRDSVVKSVGVAHQFLTKPCNPQSLKTTVQNVCSMRERFSDEFARKILSCVQQLPSQDSVYAQLACELNSAAPCIERVGQILEQDVAMCAKTVQLVSSGFFGTPQRVTNATHAARLLGLDILKDLWDASVAFVPSDVLNCSAADVQQLNHHSLAIAAAAQQIAETVTSDRLIISDAYLAGMLHDIGALALLSPTPTATRAEIGRRLLTEPGRAASPAAACIHSGGYLAALWGFDERIIQAIGYHHAPGLCPNQSFGPLTAVHVAHSLLEPAACGPASDRIAVDMDYLMRVGCTEQLPRWREIGDSCHFEGETP